MLHVVVDLLGGSIQCSINLLFYNSQSQANWTRKNGQALPAIRGKFKNLDAVDILVTANYYCCYY
jgi:hypothetical protein